MLDLGQILSGYAASLPNDIATGGGMFSANAFNKDAAGNALPDDQLRTGAHDPRVWASLLGNLGTAVAGPDSAAGRIGQVAANWGQTAQAAELMQMANAANGIRTPVVPGVSGAAGGASAVPSSGGGAGVSASPAIGSIGSLVNNTGHTFDANAFSNLLSLGG